METLCDMYIYVSSNRHTQARVSWSCVLHTNGDGIYAFGVLVKLLYTFRCQSQGSTPCYVLNALESLFIVQNARYINKWMKYIYAYAYIYLYIYIYMKQHTLQTRTRWGLFVINNKDEAMCIMTFKFIFYPVTIVFSYFLMNFRWQCLLFKPAGCYLYLRVYR